MPKRPEEPLCGPMIHARLDETTHRKRTIRAALKKNTIQHPVAAVIRREGGLSERSKK